MPAFKVQCKKCNHIFYAYSNNDNYGDTTECPICHCKDVRLYVFSPIE